MLSNKFPEFGSGWIPPEGILVIEGSHAKRNNQKIFEYHYLVTIIEPSLWDIALDANIISILRTTLQAKYINAIL